MSKVQLQGNASGTGIFTIASPNSNTDRTLTLPDNTGTLLTSGSAIARSQMPSGSVIQTVESVRTSGLTLTNVHPTYTEYLSGSITTTVANSKIMVIANVPLYMSGSATWTISAYQRLSENGTYIEGYEHPGPNSGTEQSSLWSMQYLSDAKAIGTYTYGLASAITQASGGSVTYARTTGGYVSKTRMFLLEIAP